MKSREGALKVNDVWTHTAELAIPSKTLHLINPPFGRDQFWFPAPNSIAKPKSDNAGKVRNLQQTDMTRAIGFDIGALVHGGNARRKDKWEKVKETWILFFFKSLLTVRVGSEGKKRCLKTVHRMCTRFFPLSQTKEITKQTKRAPLVHATAPAFSDTHTGNKWHLLLLLHIFPVRFLL